MLLGTLRACLLESLFKCKGVKHSMSSEVHGPGVMQAGEEAIRAGEGTIKAGQNF